MKIIKNLFRTCLIMLAGLLALVTPLRAQNPPTYLFQIDSSAVSGGFRAGGVALDRSNNVYVTERANDRVLKFARNGTYLGQWGSLGTNNGQFQYPADVAVDSVNNVYVVDSNNSRVQKFDNNGNYLTQWGSYGSENGQFRSPEGIAVDSGNNVYVADNLNARVQKFDSNGNYLTQLGGWTNQGSGNGQFNGPIGVATDSSDNVYVTDSYYFVGVVIQNNHRVEKFDGNGNYLTQWGGSGNTNAQFAAPTGIAVDSSNNVYVADSGADVVDKFTSGGTYLTQWGSYGSGPSRFILSQEVSIAVDSSGNLVYVPDSGNDRIQNRGRKQGFHYR